VLGLEEKPLGDLRNSKAAFMQARSARGASGEPARRLNWTSDAALLQLFSAVLNLYWYWKTKAHLISIKITVRRKSVLRVMGCKRIQRLLGLGFFEDENNLN